VSAQQGNSVLSSVRFIQAIQSDFNYKPTICIPVSYEQSSLAPANQVAADRWDGCASWSATLTDNQTGAYAVEGNVRRI
jgi:hypothetical protein